MKCSVFILLSLAVSLAVAACSTPAGSPTRPSPVIRGSTQPTVADGTATDPDDLAAAGPVLPSGADSSTSPEPAASDPTTAESEYRVTYDWAVPWDGVTIPHAVQAPIAPAPALPLPYLEAIDVSNHPEPTPGYGRISFFFRGAVPGYTSRYGRSLVAEGSGASIPLDGNGVLRIGFVSAQAGDNAGESTVKTAPTNPIGFQNIKSYGFAGDYEGYVTYGLGIQIAPDSDQVLQIRAGEHERPDGAGGIYYVVHIDVQNG
jgi:hypothetical protein